ncbi:MAG: hypothetical protein ACYCVD_13645 [Desulfitobacteriaceae bacterium]
MKEISAIIQSAMNLLPPEAQSDLFKLLGNSNEIEASPAGAILMGMYVLEIQVIPPPYLACLRPSIEWPMRVL